MTSVIIIDDDHDSVDALEEHMIDAGIQVLGKGYNGEEAYQLYKQKNPDIVLLDMKMPQYDGAYALDKIKKFDPNSKIIVITGYSDYEFARDEVSAIFKKPYEIDELLTKIKTI